MKEHPFEPADEELLLQAVRGMREDLPDAARMQQLERRLAPVMSPDAVSVRWWQRRELHVLAGAAVVAASVFTVAHRPVDGSAASLSGVSSHAASDERVAPSPVAVTSMDTSETASVVPVVSIDALPSAALPRPRPAAEASSRRAEEPGATASERPKAPPAEAGDELALLERARTALASEPARTLALADEHVRRFQRPALAQERERLAIEALVRLGRHGEAEERARRFEETYPSSAHLARVRALVAPPAAP